MTNDELLTLAHAILIRCAETGQDCIEIEKAVNTINQAQETQQDVYFAFAVLAAEIEDFEYWNNKKSAL